MIIRDNGWEPYQKAVNLIEERQAAWKFLMGLCGKRVLNIDTTFGTTSISLAQSFDEVYTLHFDERVLKCIKKRVEELGLKNILFYTIDNMFHLPFLTGYFDAAVLHNLEQILHYATLIDKRNSETSIQWLLKEFYRVLSFEGVVFLSGQNKYGYDVMIRKLKSLEKNSEKQRRYLSIFSLKRIIKRAKFNNDKFYSLYPRLDYTSEIMNFGRTIFNGNTTYKERLKSYIFNNRLFKYFSPAMGVIATKNDDYVSFAERLLFAIKEKGVLPADLNSKLTLKRYLILSGKVILTIGEKKDTYPNLIVKLPLSEDSLIRCRNESNILKDLQKIKIRITNEVPTFYYEGKLYGQPYFIQSALKGFSIDIAIKGMKQVFLNAVETLIKFHQDTSYEAIIDAQKCEDLFLKSIHKISQSLGDYASEELAYIKDYLKERVMGRKLNLVWEHGDYYHENTLINPKTLEITGIIDWENSKNIGLPCLDIFYLLTRTEMLLRQKGILAVFIEKIFPLRLSDFEKDIFNRYLRAVSIPEEMISPLLIIFWLEHIANRTEFQMQKTFWNETCHKVLERIKGFVSAEAAIDV